MNKISNSKTFIDFCVKVNSGFHNPRKNNVYKLLLIVDILYNKGLLQTIKKVYPT